MAVTDSHRSFRPALLAIHGIQTLDVGCSMLDVRCSRPDVGRSRPRAAFTLVELLVVMGIVALFAGVIGFALRGGGGSTVGLQASQSILVGLLTQARSQAVLTGRDAAVLIHNDTINLPERYLRYAVAVIRNDADTEWIPLDSGVMLPKDCVVVPDPALTGNWVESGTDWAPLRSSALASAGAAIAVESNTPQSWLIARYTPRGTSSGGNIVVANIRDNSPESSTPFRFVNPDNVRGILISTYGQNRLANDPSAL